VNTPKPHNPDGLESPGEGYRFLDEDEVKCRPITFEIEAWCGRSGWTADTGLAGSSTYMTYRTKLSREELAKLV